MMIDIRRRLVHFSGKVMIVAALLGLGALPVVAAAQQVTAMQNLDQNRFVGTWFEIARYPYKREKTCVSNTVLLVAIADKANQMQFVNSCKDKKGYVDVRHSTARGAKPKAGKTVATGEFKITSIWPFSTKIWVLGLAEDDSWAVVGSPDHKHLWIFSKAPKMEPATLSRVEQLAGGEGYDVGKLMMTPSESAGASGVITSGGTAGAK